MKINLKQEGIFIEQNNVW